MSPETPEAEGAFVLDSSRVQRAGQRAVSDLSSRRIDADVSAPARRVAEEIGSVQTLETQIGERASKLHPKRLGPSASLKSGRCFWLSVPSPPSPRNSTVHVLGSSLLVPPSGVSAEDVDTFGGHYPVDRSSLDVALPAVLNSTFTCTNVLEGSYTLSESLVRGCTSGGEAGSAGVILGRDDPASVRRWAGGRWEDERRSPPSLIRTTVQRGSHFLVSPFPRRGN